MLKLYRKYLCTFFLSLALGYAHAQAPTQPSLLWKIEGKNLPAPSYLYGTIHLICPTDFVMSDTLKGCLKQTRQLVLEIDMDDPGMMMAMARSMMMQDNKQLKDLVSQEDYERLTAYFKDSVGLNIVPFERAKPFVLMSILLNRVLTCQPQSYELSLMNLARQQQAEVLGLETVEEQMAVFDSIPYTDQARMVVALMDSMPQARREFGKMVELYRQQNLQGLYALTLKSEFELENQQEVLLNARNRKWIPLLEEEMAEKPTFVAVGAAHLAGEQGVIALLRKQGYTLTPILAR
ncbi:MAG: TraB/GumN family protein [Bacteroidetes bacterium]|nr:TraB/GumN family protein [Bacteroidota bacterium]